MQTESQKGNIACKEAILLDYEVNGDYAEYITIKSLNE